MPASLKELRRARRERGVWFIASTFALAVGSGRAEACDISDIAPPPTFPAIASSANIDCVAVENGATVVGGVVNSGAVNAPPSTAAISIDASTVSGAVTNFGALIATNAGGIAVFAGSVSAGITNSGSVSSSSASDSTGISAVGQGIITGNIANNGSITATTASESLLTFAQAIDIDSGMTITGGILNSSSGVIAATGGMATAINIGNTFLFSNHSPVTSVQGGIVNSGTITAEGEASGINISGASGEPSMVSGGITNHGTVSATNPGNIEFLDSRAIEIFDNVTLTGGIVNTGTLAATGPLPQTLDIEAQAPFLAEPNISGGILNAGSVTATAGEFAGSTFEARAISLVDAASFVGDIHNTGLIAATSRNTDPPNLTSALYILDTPITGSIINGGTMMAAAPVGAATIALINSSEVDGALINSGTIEAEGPGATAIFVQFGGSFGGGITNTGTISGTANAIDLSSASTATTINQEGGAIIGRIALSTHGDTLDITGGSIAGDVAGPATPAGTIDVAPSAGSSFTYANHLSNVAALNLNSGMFLLTQSATVGGIGTFTQQPGTMLGFAVGPTNNSSATISATTVNIPSTATIEAFPVAAAFTPGKSYSYSIASWTTNPNSALPDAASSSPLLAASLATVGNSYQLNVTALPFASVGGLTPSQQSLAGALLPLEGVTAGTPLVSQLYALSATQYRQSLSALAPQTQTAALTTVATTFSDVQQTIEARLALGDGASGDDLGSGIRIAQLGIPSRPLGPAGSAHLWTRAFGGWGTADTTASATGFSERHGGATLGADASPSPDLTLGGLVALGQTDLELASGAGSTASTDYQGALYAQERAGRWYADGAVGFGWTSNSETRNILFPGFAGTANGTYAGQTYSAYGETGLALSLADASIVPLAGLRFTHLRTDAYSEYGAGAADLAVASNDADSLAILFGARASEPFAVGGTVLTPEVSAIWQHEALSPVETVTAAFAAAPGSTFTTKGAAQGRDTALLGVALSGQASDGVSLFADYEAEINSSYRAQSVSAGLRVAF